MVSIVVVNIDGHDPSITNFVWSRDKIIYLIYLVIPDQ